MKNAKDIKQTQWVNNLSNKQGKIVIRFYVLFICLQTLRERLLRHELQFYIFITTNDIPELLVRCLNIFALGLLFCKFLKALIMFADTSVKLIVFHRVFPITITNPSHAERFEVVKSAFAHVGWVI